MNGELTPWVFLRSNRYLALALTVVLFNMTSSSWSPAVAADADDLQDEGSTFVGPGPVNDTCAGAIPLAIPSTTIANTIGAAIDTPLAITCNGVTVNGVGVWYKIVGTGAPISASTCNPGSSFDTRLHVFTSANGCPGPMTCAAGASPAGSNNASGCGNRSVVNWASIQGTTYYVLVSGSGAATGNFQLDVQSATAYDNCAQAITISEGTQPFSNFNSTIDGVAESTCAFPAPGTPPNQIHRDIWFNYNAPETQTVRFSLCNSASFDTRMSVYSGCACPPPGPPIDCDDDFDGHAGECGLTSQVDIPVTAGQCYKIRVGGYNDTEQGAGTITVMGVPASNCVTGEIVTSIPPSDTVDARQPSPPNGSPMQGIGSVSEPIQIQLPANFTDAATCFELCETSDHGLGANSIASVAHQGNGLYSIILDRPITPGAVTTISYTGGTGAVSYTWHPGNANGDIVAGPVDILFLIDTLNGAATPPHGIYSQDIDRSGVGGPSDILRLIDLLNGADAYDVWNNTLRPSPTGCP